MSLVYRRYVFCRRLTPPYSRSADIRSGNRPGKLADTTARKTKFQGKKKSDRLHRRPLQIFNRY